MYEGYVYNAPKTAVTKAGISKHTTKSRGRNEGTKHGHRETFGTERTNPMQRENFSSSNGSNSDGKRDDFHGYADMDDYSDEYHRRRMEWDRQDRDARRREKEGASRGVDSMNKVFHSAAEVGSNLADAAGDAAVAAASTGTSFFLSSCSFNHLSPLSYLLTFIFTCSLISCWISVLTSGQVFASGR